ARGPDAAHSRRRDRTDRERRRHLLRPGALTAATMAQLSPLPFAALVRRMFAEIDRRQAIFDLPSRSFFLGDGGQDLSVSFHGRGASTPYGPAAGPQSQLAQNIVLA